MVQIYNGILLSHKKNKIMALVAIWIQLEILILSEIRQKGKDKYLIMSLIYGTYEPMYRTETDSQM